MEDLVEACSNALIELDPKSNGVRRRQIEQDIRYLESDEGRCIPLARHREGKRVYYRYSDPKFSINNKFLNEAELEQVKSVIDIVAQLKGIPQFEWVNELTTKMEQTFFLEKNKQAIISFDNNRYLKGIEYLANLFHAILNEQVLQLSYKSYKRDTPKEYIIYPYHLKQFNNRWFLLCQCINSEKLTNFALDRIIEIQDHNIPYVPNTRWNFEEYFEDVIGVTIHEDSEPEVIKLHFTIDAAPYVLSKPLHGSQKVIKKDDSGLILTIEVIPNYELQSLILSHGDRVNVLEPESFRTIIKDRFEKAMISYA